MKIVKGECALCSKISELQISHIIPSFVFTWLKETGGPIRSNQIPNKRIQDGVKQHLLCSSCENMLSQWEKPFYEEIFLPLHNPSKAVSPLNYKFWALKFAVSVSWRVLLYYRNLHDLQHFSQSQKLAAYKALDSWKSFLLGNLPDPEEFEQHLLPVDVIEKYSGSKISPFLNRYLARDVHMDVPCSDHRAYVYTKMGRCIMIGFIVEPDSKKWHNTLLHVKKGFIRQGTYRIPQFFAYYWNQKANESSEVLASLSSKQKDKINNYIVNNADTLLSSDTFRALKYDIKHSGKDAFGITQPESKSSL
jgi:hypothetical protein